MREKEGAFAGPRAPVPGRGWSLRLSAQGQRRYGGPARSCLRGTPLALGWAMEGQGHRAEKVTFIRDRIFHFSRDKARMYDNIVNNKFISPSPITAVTECGERFDKNI